MKPRPTKLKAIFLGDTSVGKTSILHQYTEEFFQENYMATIGVDFKQKTLKTENGKVFKLCLWDTAGQERFRSISKNYFNDAHCVLITYDCTQRKTFESCREWLRMIRERADPGIVTVLIANKSDLVGSVEVSEVEGRKFAEQNHLSFFATSAKTGAGVAELFDTVTR